MSKARPAAGRDAVWAAVRQLAHRGSAFAVIEVEALARMPSGTVRDHLERLTRAGFLAKTPGRLRPWPHRDAFCLEVDVGVEAPRVRRDGKTDREPTRHERLWAAMKALRTFDARELSLATGSAGRPGVRVYLRHLRRAGYLAPAGPAGRSAAPRWRLLPHMNTGPRPPALRRGTVYDLNLGRQVWPISPAEKETMTRCTKGQKALIHVAKKQTGLGDEEYRALLRTCGGVEHADELDRAGFNKVMKRFEELGFRSTSPRRPLGVRGGMANDQQLSLIRRLWLEATGGEGTEAQLGHWLEKRFGRSSIRFVTLDDAGRVIGALKGWVANRRAKESKTPPAA